MNKPQDEGKGIDDFKKALYKDFEALLVKEFTTDWKVQRMIMKMQIDVMDFDNVIELLRSTAYEVPMHTHKDNSCSECRYAEGRKDQLTAVLKRLGVIND